MFVDIDIESVKEIRFPDTATGEFKYNCFSNYYLYSFEISGEFWKSVIHYLAYQYCQNEVNKMQIKNVNNSFVVSRYFIIYNGIEDWKTVYKQKVREAIESKINNVDIFKRILKNTQDNKLIHDSYTDPSNEIGNILMEIRETL